MVKIVLGLCMLLSCASSVYAADEKGISTINSASVTFSGEKVSKKEWKELKQIRTAVFAKMGDDFKKNFRKTHIRRSVAAVRELVVRFDADWHEGDGVLYWEGIPSKMVIKIGGQEYGICAPRAEEIILSVRQGLKEQIL